MVSLNFDFEHSKILDDFPLYLLIGVLLVTFIPAIPNEIKQAIILVGLVSAVPLMIGIDAYAKVEASENWVLKARIMPLNMEKEFHCFKPVGEIGSYWDAFKKVWITPFKLAVPVKMPIYGKFDKFEVEHKMPFMKRNSAVKSYVHYHGIEVIHSSTFLVELWIPKNMPASVDFNRIIPRFELRSGSSDYDLLRGETLKSIGSV